MTILITSPLLQYAEITNWSRSLLNQAITIDKNTKHAITKILSFQAIKVEGGYNVIALVELSGPIREATESG